MGFTSKQEYDDYIESTRVKLEEHIHLPAQFTQGDGAKYITPEHRENPHEFWDQENKYWSHHLNNDKYKRVKYFQDPFKNIHQGETDSSSDEASLDSGFSTLSEDGDSSSNYSENQDWNETSESNKL